MDLEIRTTCHMGKPVRNLGALKIRKERSTEGIRTIRDRKTDLFRVNKVFGCFRFGTPKTIGCAEHEKCTEPIGDWPRQSARSSEH